MTLAFGTDGVRGVANEELTPELVLALGRAAARVLGEGPWLVGRDTRISGPMLTAALAAGLASEGAGVVDLGIIPTPGVAASCAARGLPGAVVSASHNPFADNGVKLFAPGGRKLPDDVERRVEAALAAGAPPGEPRVGAEIGLIGDDGSAATWHVERLLAALDGRTLSGLTVFVDCANGAASAVAGELFRRAGADPRVMHAQPDGTNINHGCGSTHPESLQAAVQGAGGAAIGLALDGDADRVLAVAEDGSLVDGDQIMAMAAADLRDRGRLSGDTVVVTVMTNLGFRLAMEEAGIAVVETRVGDRYVLEALEQGGFSLGGEQSGHIIFSDLSTTGDGLLTGLLLADLVCRRGTTLSSLAAAAMTRLPQVLRSVRVAPGADLSGATELWAEVRAVEAGLAGRGRVLLRPSGTEPVVRVMVEAPSDAEAAAAADRLTAVATATLAAPARP